MPSILLIDDSIFTCSAIKQVLAELELDITVAQTAAQAFQSIEYYPPDLIMMGMVLPDMDGYELSAQLKKNSDLKGIPVIFISSNSDEASVLKGFSAGATDYIFKPFSPAELQARVVCHLKSKLMADELRDAYQKLEGAMKDLQMLSQKDPLTGLFNRRYLLEFMNSWREKPVRAKNMWMLLLDVDRFKHINDTYGHCTGDYVLFTIADLMLRYLPQSKGWVVSRFGGDEFLALFPGSSEQEITTASKNLLENIASYDFSYDGKHLKTSVTMGISRFNQDAPIETNLSFADKALYCGKSSGKNQYAVYENDETEK